VLTSVLVAPRSRTIRGIPAEVALSAADGVPADWVLTFDNLTTVPKTFLTHGITEVPEARRGELCDALHAATSC
jgi:mRNA-degrading endonuclease toxin of MazEF toxin-antitoxin module